jgi:hypothetical protein
MKLLHTKVKIPFTDPYVVRIQYGSDITYDDAIVSHRKTMRNAYKLMQGSWGYSTLEYEQISIMNASSQVKAIWPVAAQAQVMFSPDCSLALRAYVVFQDEMDALQFRLSIDANSTQVKMWPQRWFTIHEVVETDES